MRPVGDKVSIVLPTFNEKENIIPLIRSLKEYISPPREIVVVDDDSPDGTAEAVAALNDPEVVLIRRKARGLAAAFNRGIIESTGRIVCWMDADGCMPPAALEKMIGVLDEYDIAIGSRYAEGGSDLRAPIRVLSSRLVNGLARMMLGGGIRDYDSGFVALRREVFNRITLRPYGYGEYFMELVYDAYRSGVKIVEVGYAFKERTRGSSKSMPSRAVFFKTGLRYLLRLAVLRCRFS